MMENRIQDKSVRSINVYQKWGMLTISKDLINILGWKNRDKLLIVFKDKKMVVLKAEDLHTLNLDKDVVIHELGLTGSKTGNSFTYRLYIMKDLINRLPFDTETSILVDIEAVDGKRLEITKH